MDERKAIRLSVSGNDLEFEFDVGEDGAPEWCLLQEGRIEGSVTSVYAWDEFRVHVAVREEAEGIHLVSVGLSKGGAGFELRQFKVTLRTPLRDMQRVWMPHMLLEGQLARVSLQWGFGYIASANRSMPFVECLDRRQQTTGFILGSSRQAGNTLLRSTII